MVYRQTEKVRAQIDGRKRMIVAATIDIIAREGWDAVTARYVALRADISPGLVVHHFADMRELRAHVEIVLTNRSIDALRGAANDADTPMRALVAGIRALHHQHDSRPAARAMLHIDGYHLAIRTELECLIRAAFDLDIQAARLASRAALGVICEMAAGTGPADKRLSYAVLFVLRGLGMTETVARKALAFAG